MDVSSIRTIVTLLLIIFAFFLSLLGMYLNKTHHLGVRY